MTDRGYSMLFGVVARVRCDVCTLAAVWPSQRCVEALLSFSRSQAARILQTNLAFLLIDFRGYRIALDPTKTFGTDGDLISLWI